MKEQFEILKEKFSLIVDSIKNYFENKAIKKSKFLLFLFLFLFFIGSLLLNYVNYKYNEANVDIKQKILKIKQQNNFLMKNKNKLVLIKTLNLNKEIKNNLQLLNFLYEINNYINDYNNWMWKIKIKSVQKTQWKNEVVIEFTNVIKYKFFDDILRHMKLYKLNVKIKELNIQVDSNNKEYLSYNVKIKFDYYNLMK